MLKIAKVKSEKEFYKKYPTEEAFMKAHGKALQKAAMGKNMVNKQLKQLTDFGNPPIAENGFSYANSLANIKSNLANSQEEAPVDEKKDALSTIVSIGGDMAKNMTSGEGNDEVMMDAFRRGGHIPHALGGGLFGKIAGGLKDFTKSQGGLGNMLGNVAGAGQKQGGGFSLENAAGGLFGGKDSAGGAAGAGAGGAKGAAGKGGDGAAYVQAGLDVVKGIGQMKEQKKAQGKADQAAQLSGLTKQANVKSNAPTTHNFARPEDALVQPDQLSQSGGTGTNFLQMQYGGEIQNTYAPNTLYDDLGYEPLEQYRHGGNIPTAEFGDYFQDSGQASIGKGVGSAIGKFTGIPGADKVGALLGTVAGNLLGGAKDANKLKATQAQTERNTKEAAFTEGTQSIQAQNSAFMKQGGWVSHDWQPQVITKFGEYNTKDLLKPDPMMNTLRSGGHLAQVNYTPPSAEAMFTGRRDLPYQMEDGGYMAMGGELKTHWGGEAELMSYNPYIPGGGETVMFRGQSHDDTNEKGQSGIGITYGDSPVEVERGEPMTEMNDGGVVFGNMMMPGKKQKFKKYAADLSKTEAKQNKIMDKATKLALTADENDPFGRLSLNSSEASLIGANMKLKDIATKKQDAADLQNAILDTAEEMGLVADDLAKGKIKKAKVGGKLTAQSGYNFNPETRQMELIDDVAQYASINEPIITPSGEAIPNQQFKLPLSMATSNFGGVDIFGNYAGPSEAFASDSKGQTDKSKFDWDGLSKAVTSNFAPFLRPTDQEGLDPAQLYPEMLALATNQLEPVQAQKFQPLLQGAPSDISYQDQLNEITAQSRAAERMMQNNPEAAANLFAQVAQAKGKVLADQFRANQERKEQVYAGNRNLLNQAQLQNLQILDQQYQRQAQAKSNTKAQAMEAMKSIADKTAKNKLENRQLGIMENMYNYRFDEKGRAINMNAPASINMSGNGKGTSSLEELPDDSEYTYTKDSSGKYKIKGIAKKGKAEKERNGAIVKATKLKNI